MCSRVRYCIGAVSSVRRIGHAHRLVVGLPEPDRRAGEIRVGHRRGEPVAGQPLEQRPRAEDVVVAAILHHQVDDGLDLPGPAAIAAAGEDLRDARRTGERTHRLQDVTALHGRGL
jgi:hypothetical protein